MNELIEIRPGYSIMVNKKALAYANKKGIKRTRIDPEERAAILGHMAKRKLPKYSKPLLDEAVILAAQIGTEWAGRKLRVAPMAIKLHRCEKRRLGEPLPPNAGIRGRKKGGTDAFMAIKRKTIKQTRTWPKRTYRNGPPGTKPGWRNRKANDAPSTPPPPPDTSRQIGYAAYAQRQQKPGRPAGVDRILGRPSNGY